MIWERVKSVYRFGRGTFYLYLLTCVSLVLFIVLFPLMVIARILCCSGYRKFTDAVEAVWSDYIIGMIDHLVPTQVHVSVPDELVHAKGGVEDEAMRHLILAYDFDKHLREQAMGIDGDRPACDIVIANHQLYTDWLYLWALLSRAGRGGSVKIVLKRSLQWLPILGQGMRLLDFIFVHRDWQKDRVKFLRRVKRISEAQSPYALIVFPEGTTLTPKNQVKSDAFALKNGYLAPKYTLLPRTTGLLAAVETLQDTFDGILDVTMAFSGIPPGSVPEEYYTLGSILYSNHAPREVHFYLRYYAAPKIPYGNADEFGDWLRNVVWVEKEKQMESFTHTGIFKGRRSRTMTMATPAAKFAFYSLSLLVLTGQVAAIALFIVFIRTR